MGGSCTKSATVKCGPENRPSIVLLGTGAVGKSTIIRQIKLTQGDGVNVREKNSAVNAMLYALIRATGVIGDVLAENEEDDIPDSIFEHVETVASIASRDRYKILIDGTESFSTLEMEQELLCSCLRELWDAKIVKDCRRAMNTIGQNLENHLAFQTADLCLRHLDCMFETGFELNNDDMVRVRNPTTMMAKTIGCHNGEEFELIDVGGQKHFHQEWDQALTLCSGPMGGGILFVVSLVDYSFVDSDGSNRLDQALATWRKLLHDRTIAKIPVILLLNKKDLLPARLKTHPMTRCSLFPKKGAKTHWSEAAEVVAERCIKEVVKLFKADFLQSPYGDAFQGKLEWYSTCATDSKMITGIMTSVIQSMNNGHVLDMFGGCDAPDTAVRGAFKARVGSAEDKDFSKSDSDYYQSSKKDVSNRRRGSMN